MILTFCRKLIVQSSPTSEGQRVDVLGTDPEGRPFSFLKLVSTVQFWVPLTISKKTVNTIWVC